MKRQHQLDAVGFGCVAHLSDVGHVVGLLIVDQVNAFGRADGLVQRNHLRFGQRNGLAAFNDRAAGKQQRHTVCCCLDSARHSNHGGCVANFLEKVNTPFKHVGLLGEHHGQLSQDVFPRAPYQRGANQRELAASNGVALERDGSGCVHGNILPSIMTAMTEQALAFFKLNDRCRT